MLRIPSGLLLPLLLAVPLLGAATTCSDEPAALEDIVAVEVGLVAVDKRNLPVVVLEELEGPRWLPSWIGSAEARSIALEMEKQSSPRPNTHDLAKRVIQGLESELERGVVTDLRSGTYFAMMTLRVNGKTVEIDSRPSDAIAIALRLNAPIFVHAPLFEDEELDADELSEEEERQI